MISNRNPCKVSESERKGHTQTHRPEKEGSSRRWLMGFMHFRKAQFSAITFTNFRMCNREIEITIKCFFAITTVSTHSIMFALNTNSTWFSTREKIKFFIKTTLSWMIVTIARWKNIHEKILPIWSLKKGQWAISFCFLFPFCVVYVRNDVQINNERQHQYSYECPSWIHLSTTSTSTGTCHWFT